MSNSAVERGEPLIHVSKRVGIAQSKAWAIRGAALVLALMISGLVIFSIVHLSPLKVYGAMFEGAFGTSRRAWVTIRDAMMMLCVAVGLAPAFKMRFWNIGAEGQILVGAIATAACMIYLGNSLPTPALLAVMMVVSVIAGGVWGLIPGVFKARWGTNETLFTLMMNYVAIQLTSFAVSKWETPIGSNSVGIINQKSNAGWFPPIFGQAYTLNVVIVLTLAVLMYVYLKYSKQGYEISVVGDSENTARYAGISVRKVYIRTMFLSGAICGIAGFLAVSGSSHTISVDTAGGRGFTAIIVAWLAKFNTFVMILFSFLLMFLEKGAVEIASRYNLNSFVSDIITGILLFCILGSEFFINYKVSFRRKHS
ncbi:ABC transporter permease [Oscillibacter ruminantium]|uniref:ABC transporter permease n=1 Tax=Oscillibacter ruminantium TaxID=1263547 RepID=UPI00031E7128|nr:ABC transporter permease [Oscillibacter ruminantium]MDN0032814.1 ABC transporter permease [Oscillibacter valericigenes]MEA5042870.1 ABC transporter permease [Oscillibacter ruminantium]